MKISPFGPAVLGIGQHGSPFISHLAIHVITTTSGGS
jgi:hypothetical protein